MCALDVKDRGAKRNTFRILINLNCSNSLPLSSPPFVLLLSSPPLSLQGGQLRNVLVPLLAREPDMDVGEGSAEGDGFKNATSGMRSSKFCLVPQGGRKRERERERERGSDKETLPSLC